MISISSNNACTGLTEPTRCLRLAAAGAKNLVAAKNFQARVTVDGQEAEGEVAAITIANAAPPFSVLAHGHTGECIYDGMLTARSLDAVRDLVAALLAVSH